MDTTHRLFELMRSNQCKQTSPSLTSGFDTLSSESHCFSHIINRPPFHIISLLNIWKFSFFFFIDFLSWISTFQYLSIILTQGIICCTWKWGCYYSKLWCCILGDVFHSTVYTLAGKFILKKETIAMATISIFFYYNSDTFLSSVNPQNMSSLSPLLFKHGRLFCNSTLISLGEFS